MKSLVGFITILILFSFSCCAQLQPDYGSNRQAGKYIEVNGIKLYYETYGKGEPLLLLHGNGGSINNFSYQIPELSRHFKVIAIDSRAQGRSTDSDKEITFALMASDMRELIDKLNLGSVYVVGWSDGGNTGLELAYAYPDKVKKLVTMGANYTHVNYVAASDSVVMDLNDPLIVKTLPMRQNFRSKPAMLSPNPEKLTEIRKKLDSLDEKYPNLDREQLRQIKIPVLVVVGDHDLIKVDHTISLFTSLPHAQLFIVPGATHLAPIEQPGLINNEIVQFLTTPYRDIDRFYFFK